MEAKSVLITGASTGIGQACALRLDRKGWRVFAGVRKDADGARIQSEASDRLTPVIIDVADEGSITAASKTLEDALGAGGLDGLVNNAGITVQGPIEYLKLDDWRRQMEVNVTGQLATTQAFLPLIRRARGRIVFMSSIAGRAVGLPLLGPYQTSKRALEALAETFRIELLPSGIRVSVIEPGSIATPIWEKGDSTFDEIVASLPPEGQDRYREVLVRGRKVAAAQGRRGIPPDKVAAKVEHALTSKRPRFRYLVGADAMARAYVEIFVPNRLRDAGISKLLGYQKEN